MTQNSWSHPPLSPPGDRADAPLWYTKAIKAAHCDRAPRSLSERTGEQAGRVYLVDYDWRDPSDCLLIITTPETTFKDFASFTQWCSACTDLKIGPNTRSRITIPYGSTRLRSNCWNGFADHEELGFYHENGTSKCQECAPLAEAYIANGKTINSADSTRSPHALKLLLELERDYKGRALKASPSFAVEDEKVHALPFGRKFLWKAHHGYPMGFVRPLAVLSASEVKTEKRIAATDPRFNLLLVL